MTDPSPILAELQQLLDALCEESITPGVSAGCGVPQHKGDDENQHDVGDFHGLCSSGIVMAWSSKRPLAASR